MLKGMTIHDEKCKTNEKKKERDKINSFNYIFKNGVNSFIRTIVRIFLLLLL